MATWPTVLPCAPVLGSLNIQPEPSLDEFVPQDGGTAIRRKRYSASFIYSGEIVLNKLVDYDEFMRFWLTTTAQGALSFTMRDWADNIPRTFEFAQAPTMQRGAAGSWRVALVLRRHPIP